MYKIALITKEDIIRKREPRIYDNIRTASLMSSRILLTDDNNHILTFSPSSISSIVISTPGEEVIFDEE